jgi:hypothetical protein
LAGQIFIVDKVKVIEFKYVVVVLATEKPAEKSAGFCFGQPFVSPGSYSFHMDFSLERARTLQPDVESEEWLLEVSWLYNRVVETGSQIPVIDLAYELVLPEEFVGECVSYAMDLGFLTAPKRGTFGGVITPKALRKLKQVGKHKQ